MRVVFHGNTAKAFGDGLAELLAFPAEIRIVAEDLNSPEERAWFAQADAVVTPRLDRQMPEPAQVRLFQCPGAGFDAIDRSMLPPGAALCNCFGHEDAIAEYVMAAILMHQIPIAEADRRLRRDEWMPYWAGNPNGLHGEVAGRTLALVGFGHIGRAVAARARLFGLRVLVANRTAPGGDAAVEDAVGLDRLLEVLQRADFVVVALALTQATKGLVGRAALAAMQPHALLINVARGPVVDERALFDALAEGRIGGAVIDTWYNYPPPGAGTASPSTLPFGSLENVVMTPHMSGWTTGTIARRRQFIAENLTRLHRGEPLQNVVRRPPDQEEKTR